MNNQQIGTWAFLLGAILALLAGVFGGLLAAYEGMLMLVLVLLGLVVGFLNVGEKEVDKFLLASIGLVLVRSANLSTIPYFGLVLSSVVNSLAVFVAPAVLVVALKSIYNLAKAP